MIFVGYFSFLFTFKEEIFIFSSTHRAPSWSHTKRHTCLNVKQQIPSVVGHSSKLLHNLLATVNKKSGHTENKYQNNSKTIC